MLSPKHAVQVRRIQLLISTIRVFVADVPPLDHRDLVESAKLRGLVCPRLKEALELFDSLKAEDVLDDGLYGLLVTIVRESWTLEDLLVQTAIEALLDELAEFLKEQSVRDLLSALAWSSLRLPT